MPPGSRVFVHSDALSAVATMKRHFSKSEVMQWIYEKLTGNKVVQAVRDRLYATHVFGAGNPMADGASRGYLKLMLALSKQLQVKLRQVVVTPEAFRLVEELTNKASSTVGYRGSMGAHKPEELEKLPEVRGNAMADVFKVFAPLPEVTREKKLVFANPSGDCMLCAVTDVLGQLAFGGESSAAQAAWCRQQAERELVSMLDASTADAYAQEEPPRDDVIHPDETCEIIKEMMLIDRNGDFDYFTGPAYAIGIRGIRSRECSHGLDAGKNSGGRPGQSGVTLMSS
jgi:hypothetical protein